MIEVKSELVERQELLWHRVGLDIYKQVKKGDKVRWKRSPYCGAELMGRRAQVARVNYEWNKYTSKFEITVMVRTYRLHPIKFIEFIDDNDVVHRTWWVFNDMFERAK